MKYLLKFGSLFLIIITMCFPVIVGADGFSDIFESGSPKIEYCNEQGECGLKEGIEQVKGIDGVEKNKKASEYIQDIVAYLLTFLAIVGVLYIIYSGFIILTSAGDEDKVKNSKNTIIYVMIGLVIIFLAGPIMRFILDIFDKA